MIKKGDIGDRFVNGVLVPLSDAEKQSIADAKNAAAKSEWSNKVALERERKMTGTITVTLSDGANEIPLTERATSLAPEAARWAGNNQTRPFPTKGRTKRMGGQDLKAIADAMDGYLTAVWDRQIALEDKIADGTITQADVDAGWPIRDRT